MPFNLQAFTANLEKLGGINEGNQFFVDIIPRYNQSDFFTQDGHWTAGMYYDLQTQSFSDNAHKGEPFTIAYKPISLMVQSCQIPSKDISTTDHSHYGPLGKYPYESSHGDIELTVMLSDSLYERKFFEAWMQSVEHHINHTIGWHDSYKSDVYIRVFSHKMNKGEETGEEYSYFTMGTKKNKNNTIDYMQGSVPPHTTTKNSGFKGTDVYLKTIKFKDRQVAEVTCTDAYPISLSAIELSSENEGVQTFSVTLTYNQYYVKGAMP